MHGLKSSACEVVLARARTENHDVFQDYKGVEGLEEVALKRIGRELLLLLLLPVALLLLLLLLLLKLLLMLVIMNVLLHEALRDKCKVWQLCAEAGE